MSNNIASWRLTFNSGTNTYFSDPLMPLWHICSLSLLLLSLKSCLTQGPHGLPHARLPFPPLSPRVCSDSCPLSRWCYTTISSSAGLFSFCLQSSQIFSNVSSSHQVSKVLDLKGCKNSLSLLLLREKGLCWFPMNLGALVTASIKSLWNSKATSKKTMLF